jgi:hypothetical protein
MRGESMMAEMIDETRHSPLPWYFDEPRYEVYAHDKGLVCNFDVSPYMEEHELEVVRADAAMIVTAVNERERLRAALAHVRDAFWSEDEPLDERVDYLQRYAKDALNGEKGGDREIYSQS